MLMRVQEPERVLGGQRRIAVGDGEDHATIEVVGSARRFGAYTVVEKRRRKALPQLRERRHTDRMTDGAEKYPGGIRRLFARIHEMEETLEHEVIEWSECDAIEVQKRLDVLSARISTIVHRLQG